MRLSRVELSGARSPINHAKKMARFLVAHEAVPVPCDFLPGGLLFEIESGFLVDKHSRPKAELVHEKIASGELRVAGVVTLAIDRYTRNYLVGPRWLNMLKGAGVNLWEVESGVLRDFDDAEGEYLKKIITAWEYSKAISTKVGTAFDEKRFDGHALTKIKGYGHEPLAGSIEDKYGETVTRWIGATVIDEEAAVLQEIGFRWLDGEGMSAILTDLTARGVRDRRGKAFTYGSIKQLLTRPRMAGLGTRKKQLYEATMIEPIFERPIWDAIARKFEKRRRTGEREGRNVGTGYLRCGAASSDGEVCGASLQRSSSEGYACSAAARRHHSGRVTEKPEFEHVHVNREIVDRVLLEVLSAALTALKDKPVTVPETSIQRKEELQQTIENAKRQIRSYADQRAQNLIDEAYQKEKKRQLDGVIAEAEAEKIELERARAASSELESVDVEDFRRAWLDPKTSEMWKRTWMARLIDRVVVAPAEHRGSGVAHELRFTFHFKGGRQPDPQEINALLATVAAERLAKARQNSNKMASIETGGYIWHLHSDERLPVKTIAERLNAENVPTARQGCSWHDATVRSAIRRAAVRHAVDEIVFPRIVKARMTAEMDETVFELRTMQKQWKQIADDVSALYGDAFAWWDVREAYNRECKRRGVGPLEVRRASKVPPWLRDMIVAKANAGHTASTISRWLNRLAEKNPEAKPPRGGAWYPTTVAHVVDRYQRDKAA